MNTKLAIPFLAVLMAAQGCIIGGGGGGRRPGNVTFSWTFLGQTCSQAGVATIHIAIPGESLQNAGVYPCVSNGYPGIVLHDFAGGQYAYSIEGRDLDGYTVYVGSGDFTIDGNVLESVDLTPYGQPTSYALVSWTFPGDLSCAQADTPAGQLGGVAFVDISMDGATATRLNCADGSTKAGSVGVYSPLVAPGQHSITLTAVSSDATGNYPLFTASHTLTTQAGNPVSDEVQLQWAVGGVVVQWTLTDTSSTTQTCAAAGDPSVWVQFVKSGTTTGVYPGTGDRNDCDAAPTRYFYLPASGSGTDYAIQLTAANTTETWSPVAASPVVTVVPGVFPSDATATNVVLEQD